MLFLAGLDWRYLGGSGLVDSANPRINLIQHVRHAHAGTELYRYLTRRAIRICVSQEVADAISATGRTNGPVLTIPNGIDVTPFEWTGDGSPAGFGNRRRPITIVGYKSPVLAQALSEMLDAARIEHLLVMEFLDRDTFLGLLTESRIAVCLPHPEEGFYLPALEAMASGCLVVTLDCIGNRGFCRHDENCLVAEHGRESLFRASRRALAMSAAERCRMHRRARDTAAEHSLDVERQRFEAVLGDIDSLWSAANAEVGPASLQSATPAPPVAYRPKLGFMIVGAQKCGTTALAHFLSQHPEIGMMSPKEVHLFDSPSYSSTGHPSRSTSATGRALRTAAACGFWARRPRATCSCPKSGATSSATIRT